MCNTHFVVLHLKKWNAPKWANSSWTKTQNTTQKCPGVTIKELMRSKAQKVECYHSHFIKVRVFGRVQAIWTSVLVLIFASKACRKGIEKDSWLKRFYARWKSNSALWEQSLHQSMVVIVSCCGDEFDQQRLGNRIIPGVTCSNMPEIRWMRWAKDQIIKTGMEVYILTQQCRRIILIKLILDLNLFLQSLET